MSLVLVPNRFLLESGISANSMPKYLAMLFNATSFHAIFHNAMLLHAFLLNALICHVMAYNVTLSLTMSFCKEPAIRNVAARVRFAAERWDVQLSRPFSKAFVIIK